MPWTSTPLLTSSSTSSSSSVCSGGVGRAILPSVLLPAEMGMEFDVVGVVFGQLFAFLSLISAVVGGLDFGWPPPRRCMVGLPVATLLNAGGVGGGVGGRA